MIKSAPVLRLTAGIEDLSRIRQYLREQVEVFHLGDSISYDIQLAVTELVTNTLLYGYAGQRGWIEIGMQVDRRRLVVRVRDGAKLFDPRSVPTPDLARPLRERPLGGSGIFLANSSVDQLHHRPLPGGGNEIELVVEITQ